MLHYKIKAFVFNAQPEHFKRIHLVAQFVHHSNIKLLLDSSNAIHVVQVMAL
jgi:hypothetical protein